MRWQRPQVGLFDAASFVEAAQRSGLMTRIGQTILHEAAAEAVRWASTGSTPPALSVNLSQQEYLQPTLVAGVDRILAEIGLPPGRLILEVPLKLLERDPLSARSILRDLASLGLTLVADDYDGELTDDLRELPLRMVKLRMGLLDGIESNAERRARVAGIAAQVRAAGWLCVGKGVETAAQAAILRDLGCYGGRASSSAEPAPPRSSTSSRTPRASGPGPPSPDRCPRPESARARLAPVALLGYQGRAHPQIGAAARGGDDHTVLGARGHRLRVEGDGGPVGHHVDPGALVDRE